MIAFQATDDTARIREVSYTNFTGPRLQDHLILTNWETIRVIECPPLPSRHSHNASAPGSDPEVSNRIFCQRVNTVIAQSILVSQNTERRTIRPIHQPAGCRSPAASLRAEP